MSMLNREMLRGLASTSGTGEPEAMGGEMELESHLQGVLFSERFTSVCYWSVALLLGIVGAGLVYWRLTHSTFAEPVSDPFGVTTPPWMIVALPPFGIAASLGHATWRAVRGQRAWKMLATAAGFVVAMGVTTLLETRFAAL
jgi:hypothetical protein